MTPSCVKMCRTSRHPEPMRERPEKARNRLVNQGVLYPAILYTIPPVNHPGFHAPLPRF